MQRDSGISIDEQARMIEGRCLERNRQPTRTFVDAGVSGSVPFGQRPGGAKLLAALRPGDIVTAPRTDRCFRSALDALQNIQPFRSRKISLWLLDLCGDCSGNGIAGLMVTVLATMAAFERSLISERIKDAKCNMRHQGLHQGGTRPFGFRFGEGVGHGCTRKLARDENQQTAITKMRRMRIAGALLMDIRDTLRARGFRISIKVWPTSSIAQQGQHREKLVLFFAAILLGASCLMLLDPGDAIPFFWRLWTRQFVGQMSFPPSDIACAQGVRSGAADSHPMHRCAVSEERLARIETALARLITKADLEVAIATAAAGLATKADLAQFATKADLAQFATKADLEGVAKNVDVTKLGANVRALMGASEAARDDMRVVTAIALRLEHTLADALVQLQTMVQQQMRLGDRHRRIAACRGLRCANSGDRQPACRCRAIADPS